jgi:16S rRNA processing protein RimM
MDLVAAGRIIKPVGIRGEVKILPFAENAERFASLKSVWIGLDEKTAEQIDILAVRIDPKFVIVSFDNIKTADEADRLRNSFLFIPKEEEVKPSSGSYFVDDIIGCEIFDENKVKVGIVKDVLSLPANDLWVVKDNEKEILIPAVKAVVRQIDVKNKCIIINSIEGLLE